jgi:hypothetical protein
MARTSDSLPKRFPVGTKYVVESRGPVVTRYVEFPAGDKVVLSSRKALSCKARIGQRCSDKIASREIEPSS